MNKRVLLKLGTKEFVDSLVLKVFTAPDFSEQGYSQLYWESDVDEYYRYGVFTLFATCFVADEGQIGNIATGAPVRGKYKTVQVMALDWAELPGGHIGVVMSGHDSSALIDYCESLLSMVLEENDDFTGNNKQADEGKARDERMFDQFWYRKVSYGKLKDEYSLSEDGVKSVIKKMKKLKGKVGQSRGT